MRTTLAFLSLFARLATAAPAPAYPGYQLLWSDTFEGAAGGTPNQAIWNLITE